MLQSDGLSSIFKLIGLRDVDYVVYRHSLSHPDSTLTEVTAVTRLHPVEVEKSHSRLVDHGLIHVEPKGRIRVMPSGPELLAERLRGQVEAEYARKRTHVSALQEEMRQLIEKYLGTEARIVHPQVERIYDPGAGRQQIAELIRAARREISCIRARPESPSSSDVGDGMRMEANAERRDLKVRVIYPTKTLADSTTHRTIHRALERGVELRLHASPPMELMVFDHGVAVVSHCNGALTNGILVMRGSEAVSPLRVLFETWWSLANDVSLYMASSESEADTRLLLRLLSEGHKDESVAHQLGLSVRTVRRRIANLMRALNAHSRFQAGVVAMRRGLL